MFVRGVRFTFLFAMLIVSSSALACYEPVVPVASPPLRDNGRILEADLQTEPVRCMHATVLTPLPFVDSWINDVSTLARSPSDNFYSAMKESGRHPKFWDLYSPENRLISKTALMKIVQQQRLNLELKDIHRLTAKPPHESYVETSEVNAAIQARCALFLASPACEGIRHNPVEALNCSGQYTSILASGVKPKADLRGCFMKSVRHVLDFVLLAEAKKLIKHAQMRLIEKAFDSVFGPGTFSTAYQLYNGGRDFRAVLHFFDRIREPREKAGWNWLKTLAAHEQYRVHRLYCYRGESQGRRACEVVRDALVKTALIQPLGAAYSQIDKVIDEAVENP